MCYCLDLRFLCELMDKAIIPVRANTLMTMLVIVFSL